MYNLLVVDDEPMIADGIAGTIAWQEIAVNVIGCAYSGYEALDKIHIHKPDIIITDVKMDDMDGLTLVYEVNALYPFIKFIILSGHDDSKYIRRSLDLKVFSYLLKPAGEEELLRVVGQQITVIENERRLSEKIKMIDNELERNRLLFLELFLNDLILGKIEDDIDFTTRSNFLGIKFSQPKYCCVMFSIPETGESVQPGGFKEMQSSFLAIETVVKNTWTGEVWPIRTESNSLVMILGSSDIRESLDATLNGMDRFIDVPVTSAVGEPCDHITKIWMSYEQAVLAYERNRAPELPGIVTINEVSDSPGLSFIYPLEKENKLLAYCFQSGSHQKINESLKEFFNSMEQQGCTIERMRIEVMGFLVLLTRKIYDMGFDAQADIGIILSQLYSELSLCGARYELENRLVTIVNDVRKVIRTSQKNQIGTKIAKANQFLSGNYNDCEMSLDLIAQHLNVNPSYFSRLFKKETGQNFIDALTSMRLEKAKPLLAETDMKISEIALAVGYRNSKYFWNIFKKTNGISPSDFRELHMSKRGGE